MYCSICAVTDTTIHWRVISLECNVTELGLLLKRNKRGLEISGMELLTRRTVCHITYHACRWSCWSFFLPCCPNANVSICSLGERWEFTYQNPQISRTRQSELEGQKLSKRLNVHKYRESTHTRCPSSEILSSCLECIEIQLSAN